MHLLVCVRLRRRTRTSELTSTDWHHLAGRGHKRPANTFAEDHYPTHRNPTAGLAEVPLVVPILRAGLGFVTSVHHVLNDADLGFVGVTRNETTFEPELYTDKLPADIGDRPVIIVDPMLATGGSLNHVIDLIANRQ